MLFTTPEHDPHQPCYISTLSIIGDDSCIEASRITTIDLSETYVAGGGSPYLSNNAATSHEYAAIVDEYSISNTGAQDASVRLVYPITSFDVNIDSIKLSVNGTEVNEWYGAISYVEQDKDLQTNKIAQYLIDGTYFEKAFPKWPELGTACGKPVTPADSMVQDWRYSVVYYTYEVTIPADSCISVDAHIMFAFPSEIRFVQSYNAFDINNHELTIENADNITISEQNMSVSITDGYYDGYIDTKTDELYFKYSLS